MGQANVIRPDYIQPQGTLPPWLIWPTHVGLHKERWVEHMKGRAGGGRRLRR